MKYALPIIALLLSGCAMSVTSTSNMAPTCPAERAGGASALLCDYERQFAQGPF
jgi:uncharacterized protein YceK